jgi:hypothetical protein
LKPRPSRPTLPACGPKTSGWHSSPGSPTKEAGAVIRGSGGCRKVRWARQGSGKSGGVRVIYFTRNTDGEVVLLTLYAKSKTDNLTGQKLKEIRRALED